MFCSKTGQILYPDFGSIAIVPFRHQLFAEDETRSPLGIRYNQNVFPAEFADGVLCASSSFAAAILNNLYRCCGVGFSQALLDLENWDKNILGEYFDLEHDVVEIVSKVATPILKNRSSVESIRRPLRRAPNSAALNGRTALLRVIRQAQDLLRNQSFSAPAAVLTKFEIIEFDDQNEEQNDDSEAAEVENFSGDVASAVFPLVVRVPSSPRLTRKRLTSCLCFGIFVQQGF